jgi:tetratricopeptide (TPR) repeat protein
MKKIAINIGSILVVCFIVSLTINLIQVKFQFIEVNVLYSLGYALVPFFFVIIIAGIISAVVWLFYKKLWEGLIPFMWIAIVFIEIISINSLLKIPNQEKQGKLSQQEQPREIISPAVREYHEGISTVDSLTNIKLLHSLLMNDWRGFNVPFEQFAEDMQDETKIQKLYTNLQKEWSWFNIPYSRFSAEISESMESAGIHNYKKEVVALTKELKINPGNAVALYKRGSAKDNLNDFRGAISDYSKAIELDPQNVQYYIGRAYAKFGLVDYRGSIADFTKAIEIAPKCAEAYYWRGFMKIQLNQKESGCLDFSKAGELGHEDAYSAIVNYCN